VLFCHIGGKSPALFPSSRPTLIHSSQLEVASLLLLAQEEKTIPHLSQYLDSSQWYFIYAVSKQTLITDI